MAYFVLTGSTDPVTPARTFDLVDDEKLAVEMVRVIETLRPATWSTILPVVARPGMQVRSHSALVEQAQQEFDDRDDEIRSQAEEVKEEALRRLGRVHDEESLLDPVLDDDPPLLYPERHREGRRPKQGLLARRRSRRERDRRARERAAVEFDLVELEDETPTVGPAWETVVIDPELPVTNAPPSHSSPPGSLRGLGDAPKERPENEDDVPSPVDREQPPKRPRAPSLPAGRRRRTAQITDEALPMVSENAPPVLEPPGVKARSSQQAIEKPQQPLDARDGERQTPGAAKVDAEKRPRRSRRKEERSPAGDVGSVDVPPKPDPLDAPVEVQDREPAPASASSADPAETTVQPEPSRKRRSSPAARPRRRGKRQEEQVSVEQVVAEAEPIEGASLFSERVAEYTLDHQRQSERERRSGGDRRSGIDRREAQIEGFEGPSDRRAGAERRSGGNRRRVTA